MKIRSLILGSVAAAGLSTGAFAADLGVMTSLDVCDALGISGLTISSDDNCLAITGGVSYEFRWGDYRGSITVKPGLGGYDANSIDDNDAEIIGARDNDWYSKYEAWLKFVATADSDFGPAKAVIKIKDLYEAQVRNENNLGVNNLPDVPKPTPTVQIGGIGTATLTDDTYATAGPNGVIDSTVPGVLAGDDVATVAGAYDDYAALGGDDTGGVIFDEAYVSIGDTTVIMAGRKGTIANFGDDTPLNWLGLFQSEKVDVGVKWTKDRIKDGGHVIQITSDLGNGLAIGGSLEQLQTTAPTAFGVLTYAGDNLTAHVTVAAKGWASGAITAWGVHAGATGTFDILKIVAATSFDDTGYWNALASASATFDIFTLAGSVEAAAGGNWGAGGSISAAVTDGVTLNLGARWFNNGAWQVAGKVAAAVTETLTISGEVGAYNVGDIYGTAALAWAPGGGFTSSLEATAHTDGAYKVTFKAAKTIK